MKSIKFDIFARKPRLLGNDNTAQADEFCVAVPDSFSLSKTIQENVRAQKKNADGQPLFEAYKDADGNFYNTGGAGRTQAEATQSDLKDVGSYSRVMVDETQNVTVTSDRRIQEFTADEVYQGMGQAALTDNPTYNYIVSGSLGSAFSVWDFPKSDNLIMGDFQVTLYPSAAAQTISIPLAVSTSDVLGIFDVDEGVEVEVSVDGGATFTSLIHEVSSTVQSGNSLVVKFTNNSTADRKNIRGFNLLYK
ncbi:MAG TPA: hypothetical protein DCS09_03260 [Porphyromonadaceae bacterium]|nr:hypothetical protein [Porphyromonadaceae bacterium]